MKRLSEAIAIAMVLGFAPAGLLAQQEDPLGGGEDAPAAAEAGAPDPFGAGGAAGSSHDPFSPGPSPEREAFDFTFPGGTLKEFANLIEHSNNALRIIVPDDIADAPVPDMHFKAVTFTELNELVDSVTRRTDSQIVFEHILGGRWVAQASYKKEKRELTIFPVSGLVEGRSVEDLMAVIEKAFVVADLKQIPQFHLHDETGVLMASLTKSEQEIVRELLTVLNEADVARAGARSSKPRTKETELNVQARVEEKAKLVESLEALRDEMRVIRAQYRELQAMQEEPARRVEAGQYLEFLNTELRLLENEMNYILVMGGLRSELDDAMRTLAPPPASKIRH